MFRKILAILLPWIVLLLMFNLHTFIKPHISFTLLFELLYLLYFSCFRTCSSILYWFKEGYIRLHEALSSSCQALKQLYTFIVFYLRYLHIFFKWCIIIHYPPPSKGDTNECINNGNLQRFFLVFNKLLVCVGERTRGYLICHGGMGISLCLNN
jgi:hypothetical protein